MTINKSSHSTFEQQIQKALEHKAETLPTDRLREIRLCREKALSEADAKTGFLHSLAIKLFATDQTWAAGLGFAATALVLLSVFLITPPTQDKHLLTLDNEFDQLAISSEEMELYEQLEFYLWLQEFPEDHEILS